MDVMTVSWMYLVLSSVVVFVTVTKGGRGGW